MAPRTRIGQVAQGQAGPGEHGPSEYRYRDSNPGFRHERAAS